MIKSLLATLGILCCLVAGCGGPTVENSPAVFDNNALSEVRDMYEVYTQVHKKAPRSLKDFAMFSDGSPTGIVAVKQGDVVVVWEVKLSEDAASDSADEVLAYAKEVPEKGGLVLMKNRQIKSMTADEFKAAPKAEGKIEAPPADKTKTKAKAG